MENLYLEIMINVIAAASLFIAYKVSPCFNTCSTQK